MKLTRTLIVIIISALLPVSAYAKLNVLTTLPDFADIASQIGGEKIDAESLIKGTQDPHFVDPKPSFTLKANKADLLIFIGLGLEDGWLPTLISQSRNSKIQSGGTGYFDASQYVEVKEIPNNPDRAMGDVHGGGNPHYYTSPIELFKIAKGVYDKLCELSAVDKEYFDGRWREFTAKYEAKIKEWSEKSGALRGMKAVVYHKSWVYLFEWLSIDEAGAIEPKPGVPPSASHISSLIGKTSKMGVRWVIQEIYSPSKAAKLFAEKIGVKHIVLPSMVGAEPEIKNIWDKFDRIIYLLTT